MIFDVFLSLNQGFTQKKVCWYARSKERLIDLRFIFAILICSVSLFAQSADILITAQTLSRKTASETFGRIPKSVRVAAVEICNQTPVEQTVPLARVIQQVKLRQGVTLLPQSAAISVLSAGQGRSFWSQFKAYGSAGVQTVGDLKLLGVISMSTPVGAALVTGSTVLGVIKRDFDPAFQLHQYLVLAVSMPPDPLRLSALGCTPSYYSLVEADPTAKAFDFGITLPQPAAK